MIKTPEQMAEEYADKSDERRGHFPWRQIKDSFLAGYKAGQEHPFQFQTKMWVDPIGPQNRWISVYERLPEPDVIVKALISYMLDGKKIEEVTKAAFCDGLWVGDGVKITHPLVSHWMPLPEPPKEKK